MRGENIPHRQSLDQLAQILPNYRDEIAYVETIAPSGYFMGFGLQYFNKPRMIVNRYPDDWAAKYQNESYYFKDPIAMWCMTRTGKTRWSEIRFPDPFGVMKAAKKCGLSYGATFASKAGGSISFLSISRPDREFTEVEMSTMSGKFEVWANLFAASGINLDISEKELDAYRCIRDGMSYPEAAAALDISQSAVKLRLAGVQKKLRCKNITTTLVKLVQDGLI